MTYYDDSLFNGHPLSSTEVSAIVAAASGAARLAGGALRPHSGLGMRGVRCASVHVEDPVALAAHVGCALGSWLGYGGADDAVNAIRTDVRAENDIVVYWPAVSWPVDRPARGSMRRYKRGVATDLTGSATALIRMAAADTAERQNGSVVGYPTGEGKDAQSYAVSVANPVGFAANFGSFLGSISADAVATGISNLEWRRWGDDFVVYWPALPHLPEGLDLLVS